MKLERGRMFAVVALTIFLAAAIAAGNVAAQTVSEIVKRGKVKIGVLVGAPPMGAVDTSGNPIGYDADTATLVAKYLGVPAELVALEPPARIPALETGKVDFLVSTLAPTPERAKTVMFTIPYSAFQVGIYAKKAAKIKGWPDLKGKNVDVNRGSSVEPILVKHQSDGLQIVRFDNDAAVTDHRDTRQAIGVVRETSSFRLNSIWCWLG